MAFPMAFPMDFPMGPSPWGLPHGAFPWTFYSAQEDPWKGGAAGGRPSARILEDLWKRGVGFYITDMPQGGFIIPFRGSLGLEVDSSYTFTN